MNNRLDNARRVMRLQGLLRDLARWRLASIEGRRRELETTRHEMIDALDREIITYGSLIAFASRRLQDVDKRISALAHTQEKELQNALLQDTRAELSKRLVVKVQMDHQADAERRTMAEAIELWINRRLASST